jgi:hypothetical protein
MSKKSIAIIVLLLILIIPAVTAITKYIDIPIENGYGHRELNYHPWFDLPVDITGQIESPKDGNWTIIIRINGGDPFFNKSGITAGNKYTKYYLIEKKRYNIEVDALWSQKLNETLRVRVDGCVWRNTLLHGRQCSYNLADIFLRV